MPIKSLLKIIIYSSLLLLFNSVKLQARQTETINDTLRVGLAGSEPFVFRGEQINEGIAIEIWKKLADRQGWNYSLQPFDTVDAALQSLQEGSLDAVVGPISITSNRVEDFRFSQPFYNSSLAIVSRLDELSIWDKIQLFFSIELLFAVIAFLLILAIVGTFFWLAERKKSLDQFPSDPVSGIGSGMWLAIVTMSTTGYGDKAPITLWGRIIAGSWMIISIIFATSMVAGIASTLTLASLDTSTITKVSQLANKKVATISGSPSEVFLKESKARPVGVNNLEEAISRLKNNEVDAIVYDRPQLMYYLKKEENEGLFLANAEYYKQGYGFAFPLEGSLVYDTNRALLELAEDQETEVIIDNYLKRED